MSSMNVVHLIGRLGKDPEHKPVNNTSVCKLSLATSQKMGREGEQKEKTQWHTVIVWNKQADACAKYLSKGDQVCITGSLEYRTYEHNGLKQYATEIIANQVVFLNAPKKTEQQHSGEFPKAERIEKDTGYISNFDDVPF